MNENSFVSCCFNVQLLFTFVDCGENQTIEHGHVNFTGHLTTFNQTVPVTCNDGYNLVGEAVTTCEANGSWSEDAHCHPKGTLR